MAKQNNTDAPIIKGQEQEAPDPHRNYELEQIEFDSFANDALIKPHKDMDMLSKFMNIGMFVFIAGIAVQSIRVFLFKENEGSVFSGTVSKIANIVIVLGILIYFIFYLIHNYYPPKKWKCPECDGGLPYIKPMGRKFQVINKAALHDIEERGIRIGHVGRSGMIIPEFCPHCGEKLLNLDISKRKRAPNLRDLKNKKNQSEVSSEVSSKESKASSEESSESSS